MNLRKMKFVSLQLAKNLFLLYCRDLKMSIDFFKKIRVSVRFVVFAQTYANTFTFYATIYQISIDDTPLF